MYLPWVMGVGEMVEPFIRLGYQKKSSAGDGETNIVVTNPPASPLAPTDIFLMFWPLVWKWACAPILISESTVKAMMTLETLLCYCSREKLMPEEGLPSLLHFLPLAEVMVPGTVAAIL